MMTMENASASWSSWSLLSQCQSEGTDADIPAVFVFGRGGGGPLNVVACSSLVVLVMEFDGLAPKRTRDVQNDVGGKGERNGQTGKHTDGLADGDG